jgi:hypothetical protein
MIRLASVIRFWTEYRQQMRGKIEVQWHPHVGDEPAGLWVLANASAAFE